MPREDEDGMNKRHVALGLFAGLAGASVLSASALASEVTEAEASAAIMAWLGALASRDPATVEKVLAPEFRSCAPTAAAMTGRATLAICPILPASPRSRTWCSAPALACW